MRTLQEKYNGIQEGKFSKEHFLAEARMQQPQLITRFNGYDDAVQILKNKGMIQEAAKVTSKNYKGLKYEIQYEAPKGYKVVGVGELEKAIGSPKFYKTSEEAKERAESDIRDYLGEKETIKEAYSTEESFEDYSNDALTDMIINLSRYEGNEDIIARVKSELQRRKGAVREAKLTKKSLTDYRYKPTNDMDKYPYEQILRGLRVELEVLQVHGTPTAEEYKKALAKVLKNLEKDSIYYTNQLAGNNKKVDLHDKMVDATAKNTVDTFNGMKKVKNLKEDHTKKPDDKYTVKFSKTNNTYQVWEGDHLVTDFATKERAKAYADKENKRQDLSESVLKEGIKNLIKKALMEGEEDIYEMQGPKSDNEYKSELADYLDDNQIYGYTNRIHDIMTGPDENTAAQELEAYLEDNQIYGRTYLTSILDIYSDYPYDEHWMNQPDEDEEYKGDPGYQGYESPSDRAMNSDAWVQAQQDMMEGIGAGKKVTFTNKNDGEKYTGTVVRDLGNGKFTFRADQDGKVYNNDGMGSNWVIKIEQADTEEMFESVSLKDLL